MKVNVLIRNSISWHVLTVVATGKLVPQKIVGELPGNQLNRLDDLQEGDGEPSSKDQIHGKPGDDQVEQSFNCPELLSDDSEVSTLEEMKSILNYIRSHDASRNAVRVPSGMKFKILSKAMVKGKKDVITYSDYVRETIRTITQGGMQRHECLKCKSNEIFENFIDVQKHIETCHKPELLLFCRGTCERESHSTFEFLTHIIFDHMFDQIIETLEKSKINTEK